MEKTNFESYLEGIQESWKVFKELSSLSQDAIAKIFCIPNTANAKAIVLNLPPEQIIKEYNAHQERLKREKEIGVGDVVMSQAGTKGLVLAINIIYANDTKIYSVFTEYGDVLLWTRVKKCNKHIEVIDWIKQGIEEAEVL